MRNEFGPLVVGRGHIAFYHLEPDLPGPRVSIVDIATGARRRFVSREGLSAMGALFVDADEVGIDVIAEQRRTIVRIPLTSLPLLGSYSVREPGAASVDVGVVAGHTTRDLPGKSA